MRFGLPELLRHVASVQDHARCHHRFYQHLYIQLDDYRKLAESSQWDLVYDAFCSLLLK